MHSSSYSRLLFRNYNYTKQIVGVSNGCSSLLTETIQQRCDTSHHLYSRPSLRFIETSSILRNQHLFEGRKFETIRLTQPSKHIAHLELDRPKVKNAFSLETAREFSEALDVLEEAASVRCIILSGNGVDFTSGVDLKSFMSVYAKLQELEDVGRKAKVLRMTIESFQEPFKRMYQMTKPIISVTHGISYGLAMELAACSDIRYCSSDVKLAIREVLIGIAADVGSLQELPKLMSNQSLLRELIYTGRNLTVDEAVQIGFVSRVCDTKEKAVEEALSTAKLIASRSPVAVQGSKRNLRFSRDKSFLEGLDYNAVWNMSMMQSGDLVKAIEAIFSKSGDVDYEEF